MYHSLSSLRVNVIGKVVAFGMLTVVGQLPLSLCSSSSAMVGAAFAQATEGPPAAPDGCTARNTTLGYGSQYTLVAWNDNSSNEDGFVIERWRNSNPAGWHLVETSQVAANTTSAWFGGWGSRGYEKYRVKAFNGFGDSRWSGWSTWLK